jgi:exopolysaccharide biosynthesis polyprenyl glycosylphosphotransferase
MKRKRWRNAALLLGDIVALYASLFAVLAARYGHWSEWGPAHIGPFTIVFAVWIAVFYVFDLYRPSTLLTYQYMPVALAVNVLLAVSVFYTLPDVRIEPKTNLLLTVIVFAILSVSWRALFGLLLRHARSVERIAFIGKDPLIQSALERLRADPVNGYDVRAVVVPEQNGDEGRFSNTNVAQVTRCDSESLVDTVRDLDVDRVVVTESLHKDLREQLYRLLYERIAVSTFSTFWEEYSDTVPIYAADELWLLENLRNVQKTMYERLKRAIDLVLCIAFMPFFLALLIPVAVAIKINSRGPVFFTQLRVGQLGEEFHVVKFRSMRRDAEAKGPQWASKKDPRITAVGRFIRLTRIDELPQILNVVKGTMSFIGPRPERPHFVEQLAHRIPHYRLRTLIKPGLTGWAQVHLPYGDSEADAARKLEYDLYYLKNRSIGLDVRVFLKTIRVVLMGKGQ